jgi:hypothetical protein
MISPRSLLNDDAGGVCSEIAGGPCPPVYHNVRTNTDFAYGGGIQFKLFSFAFRAEYRH